MKLVLVANAFVGLRNKVFTITYIEIELFGELISIMDLHHGVSLVIVLKTLQLNLQHGRKVVEQRAFASVLQSVSLGAILVLAIKFFNLSVTIKGRINIFASLDV